MNFPDAIGKAPILFLTGAGASVPLGRLTSAQFVAYFFNSARVRQLDGRDTNILSFTTSLRIKPQADIEMILSYLEANVANGNRFRSDPEFVKRVLFGSTSALDPFIGMNQELRDALYAEIMDHFASIQPQKAAELYKPILADFFDWFRQIEGVGRTIPFFTLNYDTAVEAASRALKLRVVDGLIEVPEAVERRWSKMAFEMYAEQPETTSVVLFKLHGSVRWAWSELPNREIISEVPPRVGLNPGVYTQAVIYPTLGPKPVRDEPFRTGYRFLRTCLGNAKVLFVIGCSLRDSEIQDSISDAMDDNPSLHVVALSPNADHKKVAELTHCDPSRVAAIKQGFGFPSVGPKGYNDAMGSLRSFAHSAIGDSDAKRSYPFGRTYDDWPATANRAAVDRALGTFNPRPYDPMS